jgi:hypothetical protein
LHGFLQANEMKVGFPIHPFLMPLQFQDRPLIWYFWVFSPFWGLVEGQGFLDSPFLPFLGAGFSLPPVILHGLHLMMPG